MPLLPRFAHPWAVTPAEARAIQQGLRDRVETDERLSWPPRRVAGVDVGFEEHGRLTRAAVAVLEFPSLRLIDHAIARLPTAFPYVPGLLSFREVPAVLAALARLQTTPDILLCDGQGIAHPRRFGIACHLGVLCDVPSVGVAKSRLLGSYTPPPEERGGWSGLYDGDERIGAVLRSRSRVSPLFISPGHRITLERAIELVMACTGRYRLPETTRWAHRLASG